MRIPYPKPARARAAETSKPERTVRDQINQAYF
jgi:hypothetical protein